MACAASDCALNFARTEKRSGPVPMIEYQNVGYMLADRCFDLSRSHPYDCV
jgi:hypothetical protein